MTHRRGGSGFPKVHPAADLTDVVSTANMKIVDREALAEAGALRKRERQPLPIRTKITYIVIGVCLVSRGVLRRVSPFVREHDFTAWQAQTAFSCMIALRDRGDSISFEKHHLAMARKRL